MCSCFWLYKIYYIRLENVQALLANKKITTHTSHDHVVLYIPHANLCNDTTFANKMHTFIETQMATREARVCGALRMLLFSDRLTDINASIGKVD